MLVGCSTVPTAPELPGVLPSHSSGRIAVRVEGDDARSLSASFELRGDIRAGTLALSTPLGSQMAQARWNGPHIELATSDGT